MRKPLQCGECVCSGSQCVFVFSLTFAIAFMWLVGVNIKMSRQMKSMKRMETLRLALAVDREATLKATKLDEVVAKYSTTALERKAGKDGSKYKETHDLFLNWLERLF